MIIKLTEEGGVWNLWATEDDAGVVPVYAAWRRSPAQIEALIGGILHDRRGPVRPAAREAGLNEFPKPNNPPEDQK